MKPRPLETAADLNVIIVGAGVSGLCMGKKLKDEGAKFTILEKSPRLGGTWWENTYPGCGCDVPSHLYSFSFFPNPGWSRVFSGQEEILNYLKRVADKFDLVEHIKFGHRVTQCDWDPKACRWSVITEQGATFTFTFTFFQVERQHRAGCHLHCPGPRVRPGSSPCAEDSKLSGRRQLRRECDAHSQVRWNLWNLFIKTIKGGTRVSMRRVEGSEWWEPEPLQSKLFPSLPSRQTRSPCSSAHLAGPRESLTGNIQSG